MGKHCCERMELELSRGNEPDADRSLSPDALVAYIAKFDEYGINVHDGGSSMVQIEFCPWCGIKLPDSKRHLWFEKIEALGLDPWSDEIPEAYQSDKWFRYQ